MQQELAQARQEAARESSAHQAARRALADATEDLRRLEFRYQGSIEQLEAQVRGLQRSAWAKDILLAGGGGPRRGCGSVAMPPLSSYQDAASAAAAVTAGVKIPSNPPQLPLAQDGHLEGLVTDFDMMARSATEIDDSMPEVRELMLLKTFFL